MTGELTARWIDRLGQALPVASTLFLVLCAALPLHLAFYAAMAPALALMAIFFWTVRRPDLIPNSAVFAAGLLQDILLGTPLGVFAAAFLIVRAVVFDVRGALVGRPFRVLWLGFGMVGAATMVFVWALVSILSGHHAALTVMVLSATTPFVAFPLVVWPLVKLDAVIIEFD